MSHSPKNRAKRCKLSNNSDQKISQTDQYFPPNSNTASSCTTNNNAITNNSPQINFSATNFDQEPEQNSLGIFTIKSTNPISSTTTITNNFTNSTTTTTDNFINYEVISNNYLQIYFPATNLDQEPE
jgi:hypothetical protein